MANRLLGIFLLIVSAYLGWWVVSSNGWLWLLAALVTFVCATGLFMRKRWARYLWHVIAFVTCTLWLVSVVSVAVSGWPHKTIMNSFISLLPGLMLLAICIGGSVAITRNNRDASDARPKA